MKEKLYIKLDQECEEVKESNFKHQAYFAANTIEEALAHAVGHFPEFTEKAFLQIKRSEIPSEYEWSAKYVEKHQDQPYFLTKNFERHAHIPDYFPDAIWKIEFEEGHKWNIRLDEKIYGEKSNYRNLQECLPDIKTMKLVKND
ncbi:hypothetical protein ACFL1H_08040 [Nanoarchaeota archaeon]